MTTVPAELDYYAQEASSATGLSKKVIEAQWIAENGWNVPQGYNFTNIRYDSNYSNSGFYKGVVGHPAQGQFVQYDNGDDGVGAYDLFLDQPNYAGVRMASSGTDSQQMEAIARSPWDEGHYTASDPALGKWSGVYGGKLFAVYDSIDGVSSGYSPTDAWNTTVANDSGGPSSSGTDFFQQISQLETIQSYDYWSQANGDTGLTSHIDYGLSQVPAIGFRSLSILLGIVFVVFGLVEGIIPLVKKK